MSLKAKQNTTGKKTKTTSPKRSSNKSSKQTEKLLRQNSSSFLQQSKTAELDSVENKTSTKQIENLQQTKISKVGKRSKRDGSCTIANNAYHRIARKAGRQLISVTTYYMYDEIIRIIFQNAIRKAIALTANAGNKIIRQDTFCHAIHAETGKWPISPILTGKKAQLPNFKNKLTKKRKSAKVKTVSRIATQEISAYQKQCNMLYIAKTPFENKIKLYAAKATREINPLYGLPPNASYMFQKGVVLTAQSFAEQLLLDLTQCAGKLTAHAGRRTLYWEDLALVLSISKSQMGALQLPVADMIRRVEDKIEDSTKRK